MKRIHIRIRDNLAQEDIHLILGSLSELAHFSLGWAYANRDRKPKIKIGDVNMSFITQAQKDLFNQGWDLSRQGCTLIEIRYQQYEKDRGIPNPEKTAGTNRSEPT